MKKFLLIIVFAIFPYTTGLCETTITLVTDPFPPYIVTDENETLSHGIYVKIVDNIFSRIKGVSCKIAIMPWTRCLKMTENGKTDGILMLLKTPDRERYIDFTDPILKEQMKLWCSPEKFPNGIEWKTVEGLKNYTLVVHRDYSITPEWDLAVKNGIIKAEAMRNNELALNMITRLRADMVPIVEGVAWALIKENNLTGKVIPIKKLLGEVLYYIGFSKKSDKHLLIREINSVIAALYKEGFVDKVIKGEK